MGIFDFLKNIGKKTEPGREAADINQDIVDALGDSVEGLGVSYKDGVVTLSGKVDSLATREKAVLLAGNIKGVERVDDRLSIDSTPDTDWSPNFYTVQSGDSLSKIAKAQYGDASKWQALFDANREVIKNPDLIYPGQQIRIPKL
jgi:nucleoid-associated protein YgaU